MSLLSAIRGFLLVLLACGLGAFVFHTSLKRARRSSRARARLIVGAALGMLAGAMLAFWLPPRIPETNGSPASLVLVLALWIVGGGLLFLSVASLVGAVLARPAASE